MQNTDMNISTVIPSEWKDFAKICIKAGEPLMTWGASGIGKSDMLRQLAHDMGFDGFIDIRLSITDPSDLKGIPVPDVEGGFVRWLHDQNLPTDPKAKFLINLDEINQPSPIIQAMAYQFVLDKRIGDYVLPEGCAIMAAGNRVSDRGVVNTMPAPLRNRFVHAELQPDVEDWVAWANKNDIMPEVIAFIRFKQDQLHDFEPDMTAFPSPRSIAKLSGILKQRPPQSLEYKLIEGCCGRGFAIEFSGFLKIFRGLPDLKQVETNPDAVDVPSDPCTLYAMVSSLARMANPSNMDNIIKYATRLGREFQLLMLTDISARDTKLGQNKSFIDLNCQLKNIAQS